MNSQIICFEFVSLGIKSWQKSLNGFEDSLNDKKIGGLPEILCISFVRQLLIGLKNI